MGNDSGVFGVTPGSRALASLILGTVWNHLFPYLTVRNYHGRGFLLSGSEYFQRIFSTLAWLGHFLSNVFFFNNNNNNNIPPQVNVLKIESSLMLTGIKMLLLKKK